jgi:hypothetical protein
VTLQRSTSMTKVILPAGSGPAPANTWLHHVLRDITAPACKSGRTGRWQAFEQAASRVSVVLPQFLVLRGGGCLAVRPGWGLRARAPGAATLAQPGPAGALLTWMPAGPAALRCWPCIVGLDGNRAFWMDFAAAETRQQSCWVHDVLRRVRALQQPSTWLRGGGGGCRCFLLQW